MSYSWAVQLVWRLADVHLSVPGISKEIIFCGGRTDPSQTPNSPIQTHLDSYPPPPPPPTRAWHQIIYISLECPPPRSSSFFRSFVGHDQHIVVVSVQKTKLLSHRRSVDVKNKCEVKPPLSHTSKRNKTKMKKKSPTPASDMNHPLRLFFSNRRVGSTFRCAKSQAFYLIHVPKTKQIAKTQYLSTPLGRFLFSSSLSLSLSLVFSLPSNHPPSYIYLSVCLSVCLASRAASIITIVQKRYTPSGKSDPSMPHFSLQDSKIISRFNDFVPPYDR